jgi:hypothetical protein
MSGTIDQPGGIQVDNGSGKVGDKQCPYRFFTPAHDWNGCGQKKGENCVQQFVVPNMRLKKKRKSSKYRFNNINIQI